MKVWVVSEYRGGTPGDSWIKIFKDKEKAQECYYSELKDNIEYKYNEREINKTDHYIDMDDAWWVTSIHEETIIE